MCTCPNRSACAERERMSARSFNKRSTLFRAVCMRPLACPRAWLCLLCRLCRPVKELCCDCKTGHQASAKAIGPRSPETFWPTSSALISIGRSLKRLLDPSSGAFMPIRSVRHRSRFLQTTYAPTHSKTRSYPRQMFVRLQRAFCEAERECVVYWYSI